MRERVRRRASVAIVFGPCGRQRRLPLEAATSAIGPGGSR